MFGYPPKEIINFSRISQRGDYKALISDSDSVETQEPPQKTRLSLFYVAVPLTIFLSIVAFLLGVWLGGRRVVDSTSLCAEKISRYCTRKFIACLVQALISILAPVVKDIGLSYEIVAFNGSLLKENVFRQDAGPEVDAAWSSLGVDCENPFTETK